MLRRVAFLLLLVAAMPVAGQRITSAYSTIDLRRCRTLERDPERESMRRRCPGLGNVPLFVSEDDSRTDVDAGVDNGVWESLPGLNEIGGRIEWRLGSGRPFAIIYRLRSIATDRPPGSSLIVETVGRRGAPGCQVAVIDGALPDANARAREAADREVRSPRCPPAR
jgi:hypothetical protein